jgi:octaprenyl-diphosphate synthase
MVESNSLESMAVLSKTLSEIIEGEIKQLVNLQNKALISEDEYFETIECKTAKLFSAACEIPAIVTNSADTKSRASLREFGRLFGLIYQIKDDALDYFSNHTGKQRGADFNEGKVTLPIILLHQKASKVEQELIDEIFSEPASRNEETFKQVILLLEQHQVFQDISHKMQEILLKAKSALNSVLIENKAKNLMLELIDDISLRWL